MLGGVLIKVCGITRACDAEACESVGGVDFCGFVFHPPSPRNMPPPDVARIRTGGGMRRVGVFTTHDTDEILRTMDVARLDFAQLHANQSEACAEKIGRERVIRVCFDFPQGGGLCASFLLFDKPFDWRRLKSSDGFQPLQCNNGILPLTARQRLEAVATLGGWKPPLPYFIAGGVCAENVREVLSCGPAGIDLNSGVESAPGVKDVEKLNEVLREIKRRA